MDVAKLQMLQFFGSSGQLASERLMHLDVAALRAYAEAPLAVSDAALQEFIHPATQPPSSWSLLLIHFLQKWHHHCLGAS
jgi:hypothetical protein